jgi:hypothetical protein
MWRVEKVAHLIDLLFLSSSNKIRMIKSCGRWVMWHVYGEEGCIYFFLVGNPEGNRPLLRCRRV